MISPAQQGFRALGPPTAPPKNARSLRAFSGVPSREAARVMNLGPPLVNRGRPRRRRSTDPSRGGRDAKRTPNQPMFEASSRLPASRPARRLQATRRSRRGDSNPRPHHYESFRRRSRYRVARVHRHFWRLSATLCAWRDAPGDANWTPQLGCSEPAEGGGGAPGGARGHPDSSCLALAGTRTDRQSVCGNRGASKQSKRSQCVSASRWGDCGVRSSTTSLSRGLRYRRSEGSSPLQPLCFRRPASAGLSLSCTPGMGSS